MNDTPAIRPATVEMRIHEKDGPSGLDHTSAAMGGGDWLTHSENILKALLGVTDDVVYVKDLQGRYLAINAAAAQVAGRSPEEMVGRDDREVLAGEIAERVIQRDREILESGRTAFYENVDFLDEQRRVFLTTKVPFTDESGRVAGLICIARDVTAHKRAEEQQRVLAEASALLESSLDYEATLQRVARLAVPDFADICVVDLVEESGRIRRVAAVNDDPRRQAPLRALQERYAPDPAGPHPLAQVIRSGKPRLVPLVTEDVLVESADDAEHLEVLRALGHRSFVTVPLLVRGRSIGALSLLWVSAGRRYGEDDLPLAENLAHRCALAIDNARLYRDARRRERESRALYDAALAIGAELGLETQLERVLDAALALVGADHAEVTLPRTGGVDMEWVASRGQGTLSRGACVTIEGSRFGEVLASNAAVRWGRATGEIEGDPAAASDCSWLGVPLVDTGGARGVLSVGSCTPNAFGAEQERLLSSLAALAVAALRQTHLRDEMQRLAVVEERNRLARELHDSATQSLFSASMLAQAAQALWKRDPQRAKERLDRAAELCGGALAEMRALIFELRPAALQEEGLASALRKHVEARRSSDGLDIELALRDERRLSAEYEEAAYWIVREALHNVAKHARATQVRISLEFQPRQLEIAVRDDGLGFDPAARATAGVGLSSMRERAQQLGGRLRLESAPGQGTTVKVELPVAQAAP